MKTARLDFEKTFSFGLCVSGNMQDNRISRWYFGGISSSAAACLTHPLDLIKVHLQTQQEVRVRMIGMTVNVVRREGVLALYSGLSASLCRQMTYSLARFGIYETIRDKMNRQSKGVMPFYQKVLLGAFGGFAGGFIGTPADMVNVRMQNDVKLPVELRRNYAHALDGLLRVWREEGLRKLFSGATLASSRGALVSVGQLSCYDQSKQLFLATGYLTDNILTHFLASVFAGGCALILCQPLDVVKTRLMNSKQEYGVSVCLRSLCQGRVSLSDGHSKVRPEGVLQGSCSRGDPTHSSHSLHLLIPRAAEAAFWCLGRGLRLM